MLCLPTYKPYVIYDIKYIEKHIGVGWLGVTATIATPGLGNILIVQQPFAQMMELILKIMELILKIIALRTNWTKKIMELSISTTTLILEWVVLVLTMQLEQLEPWSACQFYKGAWTTQWYDTDISVLLIFY